MKSGIRDKNNVFAYILVFPTVLYLAFFQLYPLLESIRLSFTDTHLIKKSWGYVGFQNYIHLLTEDERFWGIVANSFKWIVISFIGQVLVAFLVALLLDSRIRGRAVWRGFSMVPWMMPVTVVGLMWKWILDFDHGLINHYLKDIGIIMQSIDFFGNKQWVWTTLFYTNSWKGFGYLTIMILAGLRSISKELYESADIDGANAVKKFFYIKLPLLKPVLFVSGIVQLITSWTKFEMIWVLTGGGPGYTTSILPTYIYNNAFDYFKMGRGSAVAVLSTLILAVFIIIYYKFFNSSQESY